MGLNRLAALFVDRETSLIHSEFPASFKTRDFMTSHIRLSRALSFMAVFFAGSAMGAMPSTGSSSIEAPTAPVSTAVTDQADNVITNRQLRASSGSLSKWSVNTFWSYSAGSINAPTNVVRPNITAAGDISALQSLYGTIGARYRLSPLDSLSLSIGLNMVSPFHGSIRTNDSDLRSEFDDNARKLSANDPAIKFSHLDKISGIQSVTELELSFYTAEFVRNAGFRTGTVLSQTLMYELGKTGLSLGTALEGTWNTFGGDADSAKRPKFILGFYPMLEYVINDTFNLRTVSGVWVNEFRRDGSSFNRVIYQSVGLGISLSRDVFLYPNVQFLPGDLRADKTNLGLNANLNLF
jgi:hypothetical protein